MYRWDCAPSGKIDASPTAAKMVELHNYYACLLVVLISSHTVCSTYLGRATQVRSLFANIMVRHDCVGFARRMGLEQAMTRRGTTPFELGSKHMFGRRAAPPKNVVPGSRRCAATLSLPETGATPFLLTLSSGTEEYKDFGPEYTAPGQSCAASWKN